MATPASGFGLANRRTIVPDNFDRTPHPTPHSPHTPFKPPAALAGPVAPVAAASAR